MTSDRPWTLWLFVIVGSFVSISYAAEQVSPASGSVTPSLNAKVSAEPQSATIAFDVAKIAAASRPAIAFILVQDKTGKTTKTGTGFFVAADGKLVTNAHVLQGAATAEAKLENGAAYKIIGILKAAVEKDLVLAKVEAKEVPFLSINTGPLPEPGTRVVVVGSPLGLEGSISDGIIAGQRTAKRDDEWLQITAAVSPGSSGSPVMDPQGKVVGVATFVIAQSINFARPTEYVSQLLAQVTATTEPAPLWTLVADPKHVVLNDPDFLDAEKALTNNDPADALKILNKLQPKYADNESFLLKLGLVYDRLNLLDDAVQAYQHALKLDPSNGIGWTNLALTYVKLRKFAEAKDAALQAAKQSPDFGPAWGVLGYSYQQEGRLSDAADAFQKAANLTPKDPAVWRDLSEAYTRLNEPGKAQEAVNKGAELSPPTVQTTPSGVSVSNVTPSPTAAAVPKEPDRRVAVIVAPTSKGLHIRFAPDQKSKIAETLRPQDRVFLEAGRIRNNEPPSPVIWQQVTSMSGATGWIDHDYISPSEEESTPDAMADKDVWRLFEKWMIVNTGADPAQEALLYADPVDYLGFGVLSREQLLQELQEDLQKWPKQFNRVSKGPLIEKVNDSEWRVKFEINFDARNPAEVKRVTGLANLTWTVRKRNSGGVEIADSKEEVTSRTFHDIKRSER
jgi:tetratricopeptide (TPR) repeat protein